MRSPTHSSSRRFVRRETSAAVLLGVGAILLGWGGGDVQAVTPDSPEVQRLVATGLAVLEKETDDRLGGKCLAGLAFVKANQPNHPRVAEAVEACRRAMTAQEPIDVYSNGLAIIFLCELAPHQHQTEIRWYLNLLKNRQKEHGGWGYDGNNPEGNARETGDTSQTQYATLGYWEAFRHGIRIDSSSLERVANWLIRTRDPNGGWGYQGRITDTSQPVRQGTVTCSMVAAGMGSALICADLLEDVSASPSGGDNGGSTLSNDLPPALEQVAIEASTPASRKIRAHGVNTIDLMEAIDEGDAWMEKHYEVKVAKYTYYYLYATERFRSFQEQLEGNYQEEPKWYNDGFEYLKTSQEKGGGWKSGCGLVPDTSFAVLFMLRSTQKSIRGTLGEGTLIGGKGLPTNVARARMSGGQIVVEQVKTQVDDLLAMLENPDQSQVDALARDPRYLVVENVDEKSARRLRQLVRGGEPEVRLLAVRALGRTGDLDYAPSLIYALTDPDRRIVLEARDGLRFISRRFEGFGLPDEYTEQQRYEAVDAWKEWYRSLRPGASLEP